MNEFDVRQGAFWRSVSDSYCQHEDKSSFVPFLRKERHPFKAFCVMRVRGANPWKIVAVKQERPGADPLAVIPISKRGLPGVLPLLLMRSESA
jgi:hypothetical protein